MEKIFIDRFKTHKKAGTDYRLKDVKGYRAGTKSKSFFLALQSLKDFELSDVQFPSGSSSNTNTRDNITYSA